MGGFAWPCSDCISCVLCVFFFPHCCSTGELPPLELAMGGQKVMEVLQQLRTVEGGAPPDSLRQALVGCLTTDPQQRIAAWDGTVQHHLEQFCGGQE